MALQPKYKLYYFDCRNLGETARMIFHYAQVEFEDVRISQSEWPEMKSKFPFGKLPVLEEDGRMLAESTTIARYLGKKFGLGGRDEWEDAKIDELLEYQAETYELLKPYYFAALGIARTEEKLQLYTSLLKPHFPDYLRTISKILYENNSGYLVGTRETFIDFWIAEYLFTWQCVEPKFFKHNQNLVRYVRQIHSFPRLANYIATRAERPL
ncbi:hypothetical protein M3Y94_00584800 [Aphelenchoides besseyi]|nr:hypothetical protein M3Y94_00584800 [Aphelenchoides besseyi]KAI6222068.1 Glutathione S-transferase protein [Aphelenchoides besseyi]